MTLIRWGQPIITRVTPHNANRRFLIPAKQNGIAPRQPYQFRMTANSYIQTPIKISSTIPIHMEWTLLYTAAGGQYVIGTDNAVDDGICHWLDTSGASPVFNLQVATVLEATAGGGAVAPGDWISYELEISASAPLEAYWSVNGNTQTPPNFAAEAYSDTSLTIGDFGAVPTGFGLVGVIKDVKIDIGNTGEFNHQYYIDDNSNTIKDCIGTADAVLVPGGGAWEPAT